MGYQWHFDVVAEALEFLLGGLGLTVGAQPALDGGESRAGSAGQLGPTRFLAHRCAPSPPLYTDFLRGTPLLVQLLWIYYSLPILTGVVFSPFVSAAIALTLNLSAFVSEVYRAGIQSIGRGQREAALALGMSQWQAMRRVILPQSIRRVLPPLGSIWVSLFKDTAIVSVIAVPELMYRGKVLSIETYRPAGDLYGRGDHLFSRDLSPGARRSTGSSSERGYAHERRNGSAGSERRPYRGARLGKSFGALEVLRDIDLDVRRGEVVVIIGPSGSGKSTLLRCLNRLEEPTAGTRAHRRGRDHRRARSNLSQMRRRVGMVFQHFNLFPHMTALDNVMEGPRTVLRMSRPEAEARARDLLDKVGLADKATANRRTSPADSSSASRSRGRWR